MFCRDNCYAICNIFIKIRFTKFLLTNHTMFTINGMCSVRCATQFLFIFVCDSLSLCIFLIIRFNKQIMAIEKSKYLWRNQTFISECMCVKPTSKQARENIQQTGWLLLFTCCCRINMDAVTTNYIANIISICTQRCENSKHCDTRRSYI